MGRAPVANGVTRGDERSRLPRPADGTTQGRKLEAIGDTDATSPVWARSSRMLRAKVLKDLIVLGKPTRLELGEDELSVHDDIEDSPAALDELRLDTQLSRDLGRQTGGLWEVVSGYAVGN